MSGWGRHMDDLAAATAGLLLAEIPRAAPMTDTRGALACRDAVVAQVRELIGSVSDVPRFQFAVDRPMTVFDVTHRPGQSLHRALNELPRSTEFGQISMDVYAVKNLPPYEQLWRDAARACVGLEAFVDPLGSVPDEHAWSVLRDLADVAAAVPLLDHGMSEALLPWLKGGADLAVPYAQLTSSQHDAVRLCAAEIRARVPAVEPASGSKTPLPRVMGAGELDRAMAGYVRTVVDRAADLSMEDLRAVSRLLQYGGSDAALVLHRAGALVPGAAEAAERLQLVASKAEQLRESPAKTLGPPKLDVLRDSGELQRQLRALAVRERRLPGGAADTDLRRLAAPALEFAGHVPDLTRALELGVRESLAEGLMLVPSAADKSNDTNLLWVPCGRGSGRSWADEPPRVQADAAALAAAGEKVGPPVWTAQAELRQHQQGADRVNTAAAAARAHAGASRAQLRAVLGRQLGDHPAPLSSPLPAHPALAPEGPVSGRSR